MERANDKANGAAAEDDQSRSPGRTSSNMFSPDDLRRLSKGAEALRTINEEGHRHREDWLMIVGPAIVLIRDRVFEITRHAQSQRAG